MRKLTTLRPLRPLQSLKAGGSTPGVLAESRVRGRKLQTRNARLMRAKPLCVECEKVGRVTAAEEWDHIVPLWQGGADHESNLQGLCPEHHKLKSAAEATLRARGGLRA